MYDNIRMLSLEGTLLSYISKKQMSFYLKRSIAEQLDERTIRLKFKHRAEPTSPFFKEFRENKCVTCGTEEGLTRHHVVPYRFRRHMSESYKNANHYDVLRLCEKCHTSYEIEAHKLDGALVELISPARLKEMKDLFVSRKRIYGLCREIVSRGSGFLDLPQALAKLRRLADDIGPANLDKSLTIDDISKIRPGFFDRQYNDDLAKEIIKVCGGDRSTIVLWRKHFIDTARPQYLPTSWLESIDQNLP